MVRQGHFIAVVGVLLMGCAVVLLVVGCAGMSSDAPQEEEEQGHTEAPKEQAGSSSGAPSAEEDRCSQTRIFKVYGYETGPKVFTTNDVPGCPKGGLLSGTDGRDRLNGQDGDDELHGLGKTDKLWGATGSDVIYAGDGNDWLWGYREILEKDGGGFIANGSNDVLHGGPGKDWIDGGPDDDVIYGGDGDDATLWGGKGEDVVYGGDGNDRINSDDGKRDKLYCGPGKDTYVAGKLDYVDSSCEVKEKKGFGGGLA